VRRVTFIGIDPGSTGAVAVIDKGAVQFHDTPTLQVKGRRVIHTGKCADILLGLPADSLVMIERSQPMPKNGSIACFGLGYSFGVWVGILAACGFKWLLVRPQEWKKLLLPKDRQAGDKDQSRDIAVQLYPLAEYHLERVMDHNRAEALLIAEYGRRVTFNGTVL
jgi:hypothetical protein